MNQKTKNKIREFEKNFMCRKSGEIFTNVDTGQTFLICDSEATKTQIIDLHPSEYFELVGTQQKEDENWEKITRQILGKKKS